MQCKVNMMTEIKMREKFYFLNFSSFPVEVRKWGLFLYYSFLLFCCLFVEKSEEKKRKLSVMEFVFIQMSSFAPKLTQFVFTHNTNTQFPFYITWVRESEMHEFYFFWVNKSNNMMKKKRKISKYFRLTEKFR